jgi:hypothetical protein
MLKTSVLVVSRTASLLNRLLKSLDEAYQGAPDEISVLISWNGSIEDEDLIQGGRFPIEITQRDPYHFARNMNDLASKSKCEFLIFANDDLIMDPGSVDAALDRLTLRPEVGLVGSSLRSSSGQLAHAGIHFTSYGSPYHHLEHFADANHPANRREAYAPAVTGAFFAMRRADFLQLKFTETFQVCGEDVLLSLDTRKVLNKQVLFCPAMSGIHDAETTRRLFEEQRANDDDQARLRSAWMALIETTDRQNLLLELKAAQDESEDLRSCQHSRINQLEADLMKLRAEYEALSAEATSERARATKASAAYSALETKLYLKYSLVEQENSRLQSRVQQLENQLSRLAAKAAA